MLHVFKAALPPDAGVTQIKSSLPCLTPMLICAFCPTSSAAWNTLLAALFPHLMNSHSLSQRNSWSPLHLPHPSSLSRSVCFHCTALSQCISSDVIMINVNHAGFTVCLFYGAVGRARPGPIYESSRWQPWRRWNRGGGGGGGDLDDVSPWYSAVTLARLAAPNRGCVCQSWVTAKHFLLCWQTHWFLHRGCLFW